MVLLAAQKWTLSVTQKLKRPLKHRMAVSIRKIIKRSPEKLEQVTMIIQRLMRPAFGQVVPCAAQVK